MKYFRLRHVLGVSPTPTCAATLAINRRPQAYQPQAYCSEGTHAYFNRTMSQTQTHTESVDGQDHDEVQKKAKNRRPASKLTTFTPPKQRWPVDRYFQDLSSV